MHHMQHYHCQKSSQQIFPLTHIRHHQHTFNIPTTMYWLTSTASIDMPYAWEYSSIIWCLFAIYLYMQSKEKIKRLLEAFHQVPTTHKTPEHQVLNIRNETLIKITPFSTSTLPKLRFKHMRIIGCEK